MQITTAFVAECALDCPLCGASLVGRSAVTVCSPRRVDLGDGTGLVEAIRVCRRHLPAGVVWDRLPRRFRATLTAEVWNDFESARRHAAGLAPLSLRRPAVRRRLDGSPRTASRVARMVARLVDWAVRVGVAHRDSPLAKVTRDISGCNRGPNRGLPPAATKGC